MNWGDVRKEFPALRDWTYLNTATYGQMPQRGIDAIAGHSAARNQRACTDFLHWYDDSDLIRVSLGRLINAAPEDIAFVSNAAAALGIVVAGLGLGPNDHIVTLEDEFPNYQYVSAVRRTSWECFYPSIDEKTRLVALSEVNYSTGFRPPLAEISRFCAQRGVPLFVDGSQSIGALRFDVQATPVDVLAVHGYKWLMSPTGAGFMYVSPEFRARLNPSVVGWRSHREWRNVDTLHHGTPVFKDSAEKYEGGGLPFHLLYAMEASVNWMLAIGPDVIEQRVLDLAAQTRSILTGLGASVEDSGSQVVSAKFEGQDASRLAKELQTRRVVVAARHGRMRVSPHFYNDESDLDRFEAELKSLL